MAFEWRDFLEVARFLRTHDKDPSLPLEAVFRTAIGRAYYAAFGHALEYSVDWLGFKSKKKTEEKTQDHGAVRAFLRLKKRAMVAAKLDQLRNLRNLCDYEKSLDGISFEENLSAALEDAEYIFRSLVPPR
jgi:hypothetical protein